MKSKKLILSGIFAMLCCFAIIFYQGSTEVNAKGTEKTELISCPCGGHCKPDPGNVCTLCSEWETQMKFVSCKDEGLPGGEN